MRSSASAGASGPAANQSMRPKLGSPPNPKIAGWSPSRSARRAPTVEDRSRARTSEHAAASTDVPEPPFGDHSATSTSGPSSSDARTRATGQEEVHEGRKGNLRRGPDGRQGLARGNPDAPGRRDRARHEGGPGIVRSVWLRQASRTFLATAMPIAAMMRSTSSFFMASPLNGRPSKRRPAVDAPEGQRPGLIRRWVVPAASPPPSPHPPPPPASRPARPRRGCR